MEEIEIRKVDVNGIEQLQKISRQAFSETFLRGNCEENLQRYLEKAFSIEQLTAEVQDENSQFYFALIDGSVTGYLKLNFGQSQTELKDDSGLEIERIYVLKEFQGKKVGQLLYNKAIQIGKSNNNEYIWLGVWEKNVKAISFYRKNGFVEFSQHVFKLGNEEQTDIMMKLQLRSN